MSAGKCCGTCRWHRREKDSLDWFCDNPDCDNYADYTGYEDGFLCNEYEQRENSVRSLSEAVEGSIRKVSKRYTF